MKSKKNKVIIALGMVASFGVGLFSQSPTIAETEQPENNSVEVTQNHINDSEFEVIIQLTDNKQFEAYDIEVTDNEAIVSLMAE